MLSKYEIKKIFGAKLVLVMIIINFLFGVVYSYHDYIIHHNATQTDMTGDKVYQSCLGNYSQEKLDILQNYVAENWEVMEREGDSKDKRIYSKYSDLMAKAINISDVMQYRKTVSDNAGRLIESEKGYYKKLNKKIKKMYSPEVSLKIREGNVGDEITGFFIVTGPVDALSIIFLIVISFYIFLVEHKNGTFELIFSSFAGRGKTYINKVTAAMLMAVMVSILQTISTVLLLPLTGGMNELFDAVQSTALFAKSPYNINILELIIIVTLLRTIGYMVLESIFVFISLFFKRNIIPMAINLLLGLGLYWIVYYGSGTYVTYSGVGIRRYAFHSIAKFLSPIELIRYAEGYLWSFKVVNIAGYPVTEITVAVCINVFIIFLLGILGYHVYLRRWR